VRGAGAAADEVDLSHSDFLSRPGPRGKAPPVASVRRARGDLAVAEAWGIGTYGTRTIRKTAALFPARRRAICQGIGRRSGDLRATSITGRLAFQSDNTAVASASTSAKQTSRRQRLRAALDTRLLIKTYLAGFASRGAGCERTR